MTGANPKIKIPTEGPGTTGGIVTAGRQLFSGDLKGAAKSTLGSVVGIGVLELLPYSQAMTWWTIYAFRKYWKKGFLDASAILLIFIAVLLDGTVIVTWIISLVYSGGALDPIGITINTIGFTLFGVDTLIDMAVAKVAPRNTSKPPERKIQPTQKQTPAARK